MSNGVDISEGRLYVLDMVAKEAGMAITIWGPGPAAKAKRRELFRHPTYIDPPGMLLPPRRHEGARRERRNILDGISKLPRGLL